MRDMRVASVTAGVLLALSITALAAGANSQAPTGTLVVVQGVDPGSLDPLRQISNGLVMSYYVTDGLVTKVNPATSAEPHLATSWTKSADGLTWTFQLRRGVKFHDGTSFDARAVKINFDRLINASPPAPNLLELSALKSTEVVSRYVVRLRLSQPLTFLPTILTGGPAGILSPSSFTKFGNNPGSGGIVHPVGTGPFMFKEYVRGDHITFERNPNYWGTPPKFKTLTFRFVPAAASREALLLSGGANVALAIPPSDVDAVHKRPGYSVRFRPAIRTVFIGINTKSTTQPLLRDVRVRRALNYAIDRKSIIKNILFGMGSRSVSPASPPLGGYCKAGDYPYNPQRARELLRQANATDLTVRLGSSTGAFIQDIQAATAIAGYLRAVGVNVAGPSTADILTYNATVIVPPERSTLDLYLFGLTSSYGGLAGNAQLMGLLTSAQIPPNGFNISYWTNRQFDRAVDQANKGKSDAVIASSLCKAQKLAWAGAPRIFLWSQTFAVAMNDDVRGLGLLPNEMVNVLKTSVGSG
jgi:peptide/nickel transport system substrate-binding protein